MAGQATGTRIPGAVYRAIVERAAQGDKINRIAKSLGLDWRTAKVVVERESRDITERKLELREQFMRIAARGAQKIEDEIDKAPFTAAVVAAGVAADKIALLSPESATSQHLHLHLAPQDIAGTFNSFLHSLQAKAREIEDAPPPSPDTTP